MAGQARLSSSWTRTAAARSCWSTASALLPGEADSPAAKAPASHAQAPLVSPGSPGRVNTLVAQGWSEERASLWLRAAGTIPRSRAPTLTTSRRIAGQGMPSPGRVRRKLPAGAIVSTSASRKSARMRCSVVPRKARSDWLWVMSAMAQQTIRMPNCPRTDAIQWKAASTTARSSSSPAGLRIRTETKRVSGAALKIVRAIAVAWSFRLSAQSAVPPGGTKLRPAHTACGGSASGLRPVSTMQTTKQPPRFLQPSSPAEAGFMRPGLRECNRLGGRWLGVAGWAP